MAPRTQKQIDQSSGTARTFWRNVKKQDDGVWLWISPSKNSNHNTVDCKKYDYGVFTLVTDETQFNAKPTKRIKSDMAHHVAIFLTYGIELSTDRKTGFDVFPANGNHLDVNPDNLMVRDLQTRAEMPAAMFCAANDNQPNPPAAAALVVA